MKKLIVFVAILALIQQKGTCQQHPYTLKSNNVYELALNQTRTGYLVGITDSSLSFTKSQKLFGYAGPADVYRYSEIHQFTLRRSGSGTRGALFGLAAGSVLGGFIAAVSYKKPQPGSIRIMNLDGIGIPIFGGSLLGALVGTGLGALIGTSRRHYYPAGDKEKFQAVYQSLQQHE